MRLKNNSDKGVAGLTILLSLVTMLFVIGLLIMIFSLMGGELQDATYDEDTTVTITNETGVWLNITPYSVDYAGVRDFDSLAILSAINNTDNTTILTTNFTVSAGTVTNATILNYDNVWMTYSYTWSADNTATSVMNDTASGIATVTEWFDIFIVIGAMVVLILLTVIIITAIRGSGLMADGSA